MAQPSSPCAPAHGLLKHINLCVCLGVRSARQVGHGGSKYNKLLVKDRVGAPRTSTYDLPPIAHKFGKGAAERVVGTREGEWCVCLRLDVGVCVCVCLPSGCKGHARLCTSCLRSLMYVACAIVS